MTEPNLPSTELINSGETLWGVSLQPAGCPVCKHVHLIPAARLGQPCPNCAKGQLIAQPALLRSEPPELMLPFRVGAANLSVILSNFTKGVWLACDDFNIQSLLHRAVAVFWPMWLVDSDVAGNWQAEMGYDYQVKSSKEYYGGAGWQSRDVIETRIRWEPRLGQLSRHYDNIAAPALSNHTNLMLRLGNYRFDQVVPYKPEQVGGACFHVPDLQPENAWTQAKTKLDLAAGDECRQAAQAQHVRNFVAQASYDKLNWTQQLLPMYVTYYTDDAGQPHMVYINGQNGSISGARLASQRKGWITAGICAVAAALTFIVALLFAALGAVVPVIAVLGVLLFVLAFAIGLFTIIPAVYPWQHNRRQQSQKITSA